MISDNRVAKLEKEACKGLLAGIQAPNKGTLITNQAAPTPTKQ